MPPPLLLIHGGRDHTRIWDWVAMALRDRWHVIALDLRGHGDSDWSADGNYGISNHLHDFDQLIEQLGLAPVTVIAHSLGAAAMLRYAGVFPEKIARLIEIEGSGPPPPQFAARLALPIEQRFRDWIDGRRAVAGRPERRYHELDAAIARMREANPGLSDDRLHHLAVAALRRNEDGSYSWKFDPYVRHSPPLDISDVDRRALWGRIRCPVMLAWGRRSWSGNPDETGVTAMFTNARSVAFDGGHWLHHDCFDEFVAATDAFLS